MHFTKEQGPTFPGGIVVLLKLANFAIRPVKVLIFYGEDIRSAYVGPFSLPCLDESSET